MGSRGRCLFPNVRVSWTTLRILETGKFRSLQIPHPLAAFANSHEHAYHDREVPGQAGLGACFARRMRRRRRGVGCRQARLYVERKLAQPSASWRSGGYVRRQIMPQAAPSSDQPRPISRSVASRPHIYLFDTGAPTSRRPSRPTQTRAATPPPSAR